MIDSAAAQSTFVGLAEQNGLTNLDDPNGGHPAARSLPASRPRASPWPARRRRSGATAASRAPRPRSRSRASRGWRSACVTARTSADLGSGQTDAAGKATFTVRALSGELEVVVAGAGAYTVRADDLGTLVGGTPGPDQSGLSRPGRVLRARGRRRRPHLVRPGLGHDRARRGRGHVQRRRVATTSSSSARARSRSGTETIDGGDGNDTALFLIDRPEGVKCAKGTATSVRLSKRALIRLRGVEQVLFDYRPCSGVAAGAGGEVRAATRRGCARLRARRRRSRA